MKVVDLTKRRKEKIEADKAKSVDDAARALQSMKDDLIVAINTSIDSLVNAGMSEDKASLVVMTYLSDLVMASDLDES